MIDNLVSRLRKVKKLGRNRFLACCPAHDDKTPSLSLMQKDDGRVLLHCFAGCAVADVLDAVGLEFKDLMPEHLGSFGATKFPAADVLAALENEAYVVQVIAGEMKKTKQLSNEQINRLSRAVDRISEARSLTNG